jgi:hypothetical protein
MSSLPYITNLQWCVMLQSGANFTTYSDTYIHCVDQHWCDSICHMHTVPGLSRRSRLLKVSRKNGMMTFGHDVTRGNCEISPTANMLPFRSARRDHQICEQRHRGSFPVTTCRDSIMSDRMHCKLQRQGISDGDV